MARRPKLLALDLSRFAMEHSPSKVLVIRGTIQCGIISLPARSKRAFKFNFLDSAHRKSYCADRIRSCELESPGRRFNFGRGPSIAEQRLAPDARLPVPSINCIRGVSLKSQLGDAHINAEERQRGSRNFHAHSGQR